MVFVVFSVRIIDLFSYSTAQSAGSRRRVSRNHHRAMRLGCREVLGGKRVEATLQAVNRKLFRQLLRLTPLKTLLLNRGLTLGRIARSA